MTTDRVFNSQDAQSIIAIIESVPLQNLKAARELEALAQRFIVFANTKLSEQSAKKGKTDGQPAQA